MAVKIKISTPDWKERKLLLEESFVTEKEAKNAIELWGQEKIHDRIACLFSVIHVETKKEILRDLFVPCTWRWLGGFSLKFGKTLTSIFIEAIRWVIAAWWIMVDAVTFPLRLLNLQSRIQFAKKIFHNGLYLYLRFRGVKEEALKQGMVHVNISYKDGTWHKNAHKIWHMKETDVSCYRWERGTGSSSSIPHSPERETAFDSFVLERFFGPSKSPFCLH